MQWHSLAILIFYDTIGADRTELGIKTEDRACGSWYLHQLVKGLRG